MEGEEEKREGSVADNPYLNLQLCFLILPTHSLLLLLHGILDTEETQSPDMALLFSPHELRNVIAFFFSSLISVHMAALLCTNCGA